MVLSASRASTIATSPIRTGAPVSVGTIEGTVREVGPVATVIETRENGLVSRRSVPNSKMLQEAVR